MAMLSLEGDLLATYADLGYKFPVFAMDFHPHDNFVAFATYGESAPIMIYNYDVARSLIVLILTFVAPCSTLKKYTTYKYMIG